MKARPIALLVPWLCLLPWIPATVAGEDGAATRFPQGVAAGEITPRSAVVWTRTDGPASLRLEVADNREFRDPLSLAVETVEARDFTVQATLGDLDPATEYAYRFVVVGGGDGEDGSGEEVRGRFRTAPEPNADVLVRFLVGGDVGGQGNCRHPEEGYPAFGPMAELDADFFVANGDMIYADNACPEIGPGGRPNIPGDFLPIALVDWAHPGAARETILAHWRYNRADFQQRRLLAGTPIYAQWDDHEAINDFGAAWTEWPIEPQRPGWDRLVEAGREGLFLWNPMTVHPEEPGRIYRSFRWGKSLELFLLDARSYRSRNDLVDSPSNGKTMLGAEQLAWLKKSLTASDATWKIVSSDVPLSVPTGADAKLWGRDSFADGDSDNFSKRTGFERELLDLLTFLDRENVKNIVFVVTDVHFAANLRYTPDLDGDGDPLIFHELVSGPLNAYATPVPAELDPTLGPAILYGEGGFFNFSYVRLSRSGDGTVHLVADVRDAEGKPRFGSRLELVPE